MQKLTELKTTN